MQDFTVLDITVNENKSTTKFTVYNRFNFSITEYAILKIKVHVDTLSEEPSVNLLSKDFIGSFDKNESEYNINDNDKMREKGTRKNLLTESSNTIDGGSTKEENVNTEQSVTKRVKSVIVENDKVSSHNSIGSYHDGLGEADVTTTMEKRDFEAELSMI